MRLSVKLGTREQEFVVVDSQLLDILNQNVVETELTGLDAVRAALDAPIGIDDFDAMVGPDESVLIVTSDITRPFPTSTVVPLVLERLAANGVRDEQITIVFALGSHRSHTPAEQEALVGKEIFERYRCVDSDQTDVVRLGITTQGTPVDVSRIVAEADRRICLGNIEYHYFAATAGAPRPSCRAAQVTRPSRQSPLHGSGSGAPAMSIAIQSVMTSRKPSAGSAPSTASSTWCSMSASRSFMPSAVTS